MSAGCLAGKVAVITGASQGIGRAIAQRLARDGARIILLARSERLLSEVATGIGSEGGSATGTSVDLSGPEGCLQAAEAVRELAGRVDILVNCAGDTKSGAFPDQPEADWESGFALKFHGAVRLTRHLWPELTSARGSVVNIGGGAANAPSPDFMVGGAVNAALAHFSQALALQGLRDDVNVNVVHPGPTLTGRMQALAEQTAQARGMSVEEVLDEQTRKSGIRRVGEPEDIAHVVSFLCDPASRHVQGVAIAADGGAGAAYR